MPGCDGIYMDEIPLLMPQIGVSKNKRLPALSQIFQFPPLVAEPPTPPPFFPQPRGPVARATFVTRTQLRFEASAMGAETTVLSFLKQCFQWLDVSRGMAAVDQLHWLFFVGFLVDMLLTCSYVCSVTLNVYHIICDHIIYSINI